MVAILLLLSLLVSVTARECNRIRSCSQEALRSDVNPCCVASPSGLFVFRQRFEPDVGGDMGSWGIDGLEVLEYVTFHPSQMDLPPDVQLIKLAVARHRPKQHLNHTRQVTHTKK
jgi:hypothetical protein